MCRHPFSWVKSTQDALLSEDVHVRFHCTPLGCTGPVVMSAPFHYTPLCRAFLVGPSDLAFGPNLDPTLCVPPLAIYNCVLCVCCLFHP